MSAILTAAANLLELGTTTLTAGTAEAAYPLYRLYDRRPTLEFRGTAAATTTIHVDQGAAGAQAVDRLMVSPGHNLAGVTLDCQWSENNADWTPATAQWTGAAGLIEKTWAALTKRYWRFTATSPAAAPRITELFLTSTATWARNPSRPTGDEDDIHNVIADETASGADRFIVMGADKRQRNYDLPNILAAQAAQLHALNTAWGGAKPFWICDHNAVWIFVRLASPVRIREIRGGGFSAELRVVEVIG